MIKGKGYALHSGDQNNEDSNNGTIQLINYWTSETIGCAVFKQQVMHLMTWPTNFWYICKVLKIMWVHAQTSKISHWSEVGFSDGKSAIKSDSSPLLKTYSQDWLLKSLLSKAKLQVSTLVCLHWGPPLCLEKDQICFHCLSLCIWQL